jgi:sugar phosphate isomerase/epimerase
MKKGLVICGPDVAYGPLALLSGSFEQKAAKAARLGYDGIELMVRDPAGLNWAQTKQILNSAGLEVSQLVTGELYGADGLCLVTADEDLSRRAAERLRSVIDLAAYLGAMINVGRARGRLDLLGKVSNAYEIAVERFRPLVAYAASQGVKVNIEPLNRYESDFILNAAEGRKFMEAVGYENGGLLLDLFHMNIEESSFEAGFKDAGERLFHVHIADSNRRYPGCGHLDFEHVFRALSELGYQGYVSAELLPQPDADTAAIISIEFLKRYI